MPALNFKKQFAPLVESGEKRQTIRRRGKVGFTTGDRLYLYTGQRTNQCRKLGEATVAEVRRITIDDWGAILDGRLLVGDELEQFAKADGFTSPHKFFEFFNAQRGDEPFDGRVIYWDGFRGDSR